MKKVSSTITHMSLIGLALLALAISTLVWLFERTRVDDSGATKNAELEAISSFEDEVLKSEPSLASNDEATGNAAFL
jgi:hypothetical protein